MFEILLTAAILSLLPAAAALTGLFLRQIRIKAFLKGALLSYTFTHLFVSFALFAITRFSFASAAWFAPLSALVYGAVWLACLHFSVTKVLRPEEIRDAAWGFGVLWSLPALQSCFTNLVVFDHLRIGDAAYLRETLGFSASQIQSLSQSFASGNEGFYLISGFIALAGFITFLSALKLVSTTRTKKELLPALVLLSLCGYIQLSGSGAPLTSALLMGFILLLAIGTHGPLSLKRPRQALTKIAHS